MAEIKIAIHNNKGSSSERWIEYCELNKINYKIVDCTQNDIIDQLRDCDGLMWHWHHENYIHQLFARELTFSLEAMGKKVFPNFESSWHFDDKLGQKYLFEGMDLDNIESYVFYSKKDSLKWIESVDFPKVFKLRGGSGSKNVELIQDRKRARKKVSIAFGKGFSSYNRSENIYESFRILKKDKDVTSLLNILKSFFRLIFPKNESKLLPLQKGYVFFQNFITDLNFDIRLVVIGNKCFGVKRFVRKNDFRASGSDLYDESPEAIDLDFVEAAFQISEKLKTQSIAFDFLIDNDKIKIIEISYGYPMKKSDGLPGYWDRELKWHEGKFKSQYWMVENFINSIKKNRTC